MRLIMLVPKGGQSLNLVKPCSTSGFMQLILKRGEATWELVLKM